MMLNLLVCYFVLFLAPLHVFARRIGANKADPNARSYNITLNSVYHNIVNPDYFGPGTKVQLLGPNEYAFRFNVTKTLPDKMKTIVYTYEKNNKGQFVPSITTREEQCEEFRKEKQNEPIYKCLHYREAGIKDCPLKKGVYYASSARCTSADCPIIVPGNHWLLNKTWITEDNVVIFQLVIDVTIVRKNLSPF